jgi:hypothetical protein
MVVTVLADCCNAEPLTITEGVLTNNSDSGQTIHTQYRYTNGTFIGPLLSNLVLFATGTGTPLVSRYNVTSGFVGTGGFPPQYSTMRLSSNAIVPDNYVFNLAQDKFRYLRTPVVYTNTNVDIQALITASTTATPNSGASPLYFADFTVPASIDGDQLYLIWDLRNAIETELCYTVEPPETGGGCCECALSLYYLNDVFATATGVFTDENMTVLATDGWYSTGGIIRQLVEGVLLPPQSCNICSSLVDLCFGFTLNDVSCNCVDACQENCNVYDVQNPSLDDALVGYYNCNGIYEEITLPSELGVSICSVGAPFSTNPNVTIVLEQCGCN